MHNSHAKRLGIWQVDEDTDGGGCAAWRGQGAEKAEKTEAEITEEEDWMLEEEREQRANEREERDKDLEEWEKTIAAAETQL